MTEPNADQQRNDSTPQQASGSAQPEFGAMASQYPSNYDPYVFGRPEPEQKDEARNDASDRRNVFGAQGRSGQQAPQGGPHGQGQDQYGRNPYGNPYGQQGQYGQDQYGQNPQNPYGQNTYNPNGANGWNSQRPNGQGRNRGGVDLNDPNQNPLYGRWDMYAILAFVFSFFAIPVFPALMGALAMWRTRTFHMKGYGLALAAVIINVLYTIASLWLFINGMSTLDLYQQMLGGAGGSGSTDGSVQDGSLSA